MSARRIGYSLHPARRPASWRRRRGLLSAPAVAVLAGLALALAFGGGATISPDTTFHGRWHARAIPHGTLSHTKLERSSVAWTGGRLTTSGGEAVTVYVSAALAPEVGTAQTWADFLGGLVHGAELGLVEAYIATYAETQGICGEDALGCYSGNRFVSTGETQSGVTAAEIVRHEYGHHIAFNRLNPPWVAVDWGPKNWATAQDVCARTAAGSIYPGNESFRYRLNPGEAWAETYRLLDERRAGAAGTGWQLVDPSFLPDEASLAAAERDVLEPWTLGRTVTRRTRFRARSPQVWTIALSTPLDGAIEITVTLPRGAASHVALVDPARRSTIATGLWASDSVKKIVTNVCGQRSLSLRVTRKGALGPARVVASLP